MNFIDRTREMGRLDALLAGRRGGLGVVWGRRRVGKTRLLVEWCRKHGGLYTVAEQSSPPIQRRYFAEAVGGMLAGFHEVEYSDWHTVLVRLAREARSREWRGPLVLDEFPYLVAASADVPSVVQRWVDHEGADASVVLVVAGSSQRMMQGLVLDASAPLYGRAREAFGLRPLEAGHIQAALRLGSGREAVEAYAVWGGTPRYWELAEEHGRSLERALDRCVLDPQGPLHGEPDRLLIEETPPAAALRPVLDAIGMGAHRLSEIGGRMGQPATSLARALTRLQELGLVERETPFGESEKSGKRALYRISDPFFRMWFRVVAPHRALLAVAPPSSRVALWRDAREALTAETWECLCRACVARLSRGQNRVADIGPWHPGARSWGTGAPEWDVVSRSVDGKNLLLGEAKWCSRGVAAACARAAAMALLAKGMPASADTELGKVVRVVFVPEAPAGLRLPGDVHLLTADGVLAALRETEG